MEDAVDDVPVLQDHDDAGGEADDQGGGKDILCAGHQFFRDLIGGKTSDDAAHDAHQQEQAGDFGKVPVPEGHAQDQQHNRRKQHDKDPALPACQHGFRDVPGGCERCLTGPPRIEHDEDAEQQGQESPADQAVFHPGKERQTGHPLRDPHGKGIEESTRKAHIGSHIDDQHPHHRIVAH